jgi:uncharacterized membrane protein (DUF485 family)
MEHDAPHTPGNDWEKIAHTEGFKDLIAAKARFIVPATLFFMTYYFALPVLVGYAPEFMRREVIGPVNVAYLFALSQFFMTWIVAGLYMRAASRFDGMAEKLVERMHLDGKPAGKGRK